MNTKNMINITGVDLKEFIKQVYILSKPQGMGFLNFVETGSLNNCEVEEILSRGLDYAPVSMDYIKGRACKMTVFKENNKLYISDNWYDHTNNQLIDLLNYLNVSHILENKNHGHSCNCNDCILNRSKK